MNSSFLVRPATEHLENTGGLALAVELARISGLTRLRFPVRTWSGALLSMFGLLCMSGSAYKDILQHSLADTGSHHAD